MVVRKVARPSVVIARSVPRRNSQRERLATDDRFDVLTSRIRYRDSAAVAWRCRARSLLVRGYRRVGGRKPAAPKRSRSIRLTTTARASRKTFVLAGGLEDEPPTVPTTTVQAMIIHIDFITNREAGGCGALRVSGYRWASGWREPQKRSRSPTLTSRMQATRIA